MRGLCISRSTQHIAGTSCYENLGFTDRLSEFMATSAGNQGQRFDGLKQGLHRFDPSKDHIFRAPFETLPCCYPSLNEPSVSTLIIYYYYYYYYYCYYYKYTYTHTYTHTYIHTHTYTHIHTFIHSYIHTFIHSYIHTYIVTYVDT